MMPRDSPDQNPYESPVHQDIDNDSESDSDSESVPQSSDLTMGDWVLCVLCFGISCIIGIVRLIQGKPNGAKMIGISRLMSGTDPGIAAHLVPGDLPHPNPNIHGQ